MTEEERQELARYCALSSREPEPLPLLHRIRVTQFMRPNGRRKEIWFDLPGRGGRLAEELICDGYRFEAEVLTTGELHIDVSRDEDDEPLANCVCPNGPEMLHEIVEMVERAHDMWGRRK